MAARVALAVVTLQVLGCIAVPRNDGGGLPKAFYTEAFTIQRRRAELSPHLIQLAMTEITKGQPIAAETLADPDEELNLACFPDDDIPDHQLVLGGLGQESEFLAFYSNHGAGSTWLNILLRGVGHRSGQRCDLSVRRLPNKITTIAALRGAVRRGRWNCSLAGAS